VTFRLCIFDVRVLHPAPALALSAAAKERLPLLQKKKAVPDAKKLMQKLLPVQEQNDRSSSCAERCEIVRMGSNSEPPQY
jgi:hypothetical protein